MGIEIIDETTFEEIYRHQSGVLYNIAYHNTRNHSVSEDIVQDVFVRLWQGRDRNTFVSEDHIKHWLIRVTLNCINDHWRDILKHPTVPLCEIDEPAAPEERDEDTSMIDCLAPKEKRILRMYYYEDMSFGQIASISNISEDAARKRLSRARKVLRERLVM